jgi:hypothetical protein
MSGSSWDPPPPTDTCGTAGAAAAAALPIDPYTSLAVHYGMLLGVDDFRVLAANPRGRLQLHQAWQHGPGVLWGFPVARAAADDPRLAVGPGVAVDGWGRELASPARMCLDLVHWLDSHPECGFAARTASDHFTFSARLLLRRTACLSRPVPSVTSSCGAVDDTTGAAGYGSTGGSVQYTRVEESGQLELECYHRPHVTCVAERAGDAPVDERDREFTDLRALVRDGVLPAGLPHDPTGWVDAFRMVAARAVADLAPGRDDTAAVLFPEASPPAVLLADLPLVTVTRSGPGQPWQVDLGVVDVSVRRTHLPTWVIEELVAESLEGRAGPVPVPDAGGPRVRTLGLGTDRIEVELTGDVLAGTVPGAVEVRWLDRADPTGGWSDPLDVTPTVEPATEGGGRRLSLAFAGAAGTDVRYRVVLRGTGPTPLMGRLPTVPLAGRVGDPPAGAAEGRDVVAVLSGGGAS